MLTPYVPHVNTDGNADGGSVPSVLFQAPLGTYTGWNIIPTPSPYAGQQDSLSGGFWPFWDTQANRVRTVIRARHSRNVMARIPATFVL